jgi:5'-nucleotidase
LFCGTFFSCFDTQAIKIPCSFVKMRLSSFIAGAALLSASGANALNILLNNDDGFGSGNLREMYRIFKEKGHNGKPAATYRETWLTFVVWLVAPATKQSGKGGTSDFTTEGNLTAPSQYDLIPTGAPSVRSLNHCFWGSSSDVT